MSTYKERSRIFWSSLGGGVFIGLALGVAGTFTALRIAGVIQ